MNRTYTVRTVLASQVGRTEPTIFDFEWFDSVAEALHSVAVNRELGLASNLMARPA